MTKRTPDDWALAALYALGRGGERAVAVEPLARELGVTKGSFYWHFKNRAALLQAAVDLWEQQGTHTVIQTLETLDGPRERLEALLRTSVADLEQLRVEAALAAASTFRHPLIGPAYERVAAMRLSYLRTQYAALGVASPSTWANTTYAAYLGAVQLAALQPSPLREEELPALVDHLIGQLVPRR